MRQSSKRDTLSKEKKNPLRNKCFIFNYNSHAVSICAMPHLKQNQHIIVSLKSPSERAISFVTLSFLLLVMFLIKQDR